MPQGSKIGPLAFIVHINDLPSVVQSSDDDNSDTVSMFMDDTTMSEVLNVSDHISGESIGNSQRNLESVLQFTNDENMQLNFKKCKEMHIDFRKNKTVIPPTTLGEQSLTKVRSYKLLGIWFDDDLKWKTNTEYITKKAAKRLYFMKILKSYNAPKEALKTFYVSSSEISFGIWPPCLERRVDNGAKRRYRVNSEKSSKDNLSGTKVP